MASSKRKRTTAQKESEKRREAADVLGKVLVRHTPATAVAMEKMITKYGEKAPEIYRMALLELAAKKTNR